MASSSKRTRSQIESIDSPPHKKIKHNEETNKDMKQNEDQIVTVFISKEHKSFSSTLLTNLPYFAAKLSDRWKNTNNKNNTNNNIIVSTKDNPFIFSIKDLTIVLSCFNDTNKPIIPADLHPNTTFLSFMQCITFFCVQIDNKILMDYYNRCTVLIDNNILRYWKTCNIPQVAQFASKMLTNRNNEILTKLAVNIESKIKRWLSWWSEIRINQRRSERQPKLCDQKIITQFEYIIDLFLNNYDENCNVEPMIKVLKACINRIKNQISYISTLCDQSNQSNQILCLFLKVLLDFTKYDKFFGMIYEEIITLMIKFCTDCRLSKKLNAKVTDLWGKIVIYLFKASIYQQINKKIINSTLCAFIKDEKCTKEIFKAVNNRNGELLAIGIMEWNINNARTQANVQEKYGDFCSKYFNPVKNINVK